MSVKIFVGNIADGSSDSELRAMFEAHGKVTECDIISNYAFVHMASQDAANDAVQSLHQTDFNGSTIRCELSTKTTQGRKRARENQDEEGGGYESYGGGRGGGGRGRGGDRGGRGGPRGGPRGGRGGGDRFGGGSSDRYGGGGGGGDGYAKEADAHADPLRDPHIRDVLLRDPYVRDLIDRELYYRDALRGRAADRDRPVDSYRDQYLRREAMMRDRELPPPQQQQERDPYARPPPDYYNSSRASNNGLSGGY